MENNRVQDSGVREQLRPCPFCGGGPVWDYYTVGVWDESEDRWNVSCDTCGITFEEGFKTRKEAFEAWNRRTETASDTLMRVFAYDATCGVCDKRKERTAKVIDKSVGRLSISDFDWIGKCEKCGNEIQYSFDFCPYCGAELEWSE